MYAIDIPINTFTFSTIEVVMNWLKNVNHNVSILQEFIQDLKSKPNNVFTKQG